jgi:hypothetical protein
MAKLSTATIALVLSLVHVAAAVVISGQCGGIDYAGPIGACSTSPCTWRHSRLAQSAMRA